MQVFESLDEWKALRPRLSGTVGLVPTMGYLHEGHLALVRRARAETDIVVVWVFVNPKQFGPSEDFARYPRDLQRDLGLLVAEGTDYVLNPGVEGVYPPGFQTYVAVEQLSGKLEGAARPGHFRGVATVVAKMLCLTQPTCAYFGQKDGQQCLVVQRMAADLDMLTEIVVCPTVRESDGLALSSRNVYLDAEARRAAPVLYRALQAAQAAWAAGERDGETLRERMRAVLAEEPAAAVDYVSVADTTTLEECGRVAGPVMASLAVRIGAVRLIDNVQLG